MWIFWTPCHSFSVLFSLNSDDIVIDDYDDDSSSLALALASSLLPQPQTQNNNLHAERHPKALQNFLFSQKVLSLMHLSSLTICMYYLSDDDSHHMRLSMALTSQSQEPFMHDAVVTGTDLVHQCPLWSRSKWWAALQAFRSFVVLCLPLLRCDQLNPVEYTCIYIYALCILYTTVMPADRSGHPSFTAQWACKVGWFSNPQCLCTSWSWAPVPAMVESTYGRSVTGQTMLTVVSGAYWHQ